MLKTRGNNFMSFAIIVVSQFAPFRSGSSFCPPVRSLLPSVIVDNKLWDVYKQQIMALQRCQSLFIRRLLYVHSSYVVHICRLL